jgi:hypothetical protein
MADPKIITIGNTGKGGWWYAIDAEGIFEDGSPNRSRSRC